MQCEKRNLKKFNKMMFFIGMLFMLCLNTCVMSERFSSHDSLDFSNKNLTTVPQRIPAYTTYLSLSHNLLREIKYGDFNRMINLTYLDISNNRIKVLNKMSF